MSKKIYVLHLEVGNLPKKIRDKYIKKATKNTRRVIGKKSRLLVIPQSEGNSWIEVIR